MSASYRLERLQLIKRPLDDVFAFFSNAHNLEAITPGFLRFQITTPDLIVMQVGTLIDYRLRLLGIPFQWQSRIDCFEPNQRFVDVQTRGPYRRWHHLHEFTTVDGGTLMIDEVDYEMPLGPLGALAHVLSVRRTLDQIFDYRRDRIVELLERR
ncbi:MAG: SRPBCC family protein [Planctomycetes bacterium]|nr:SRPBCC family protein [Planctomycetota bacterium]